MLGWCVGLRGRGAVALEVEVTGRVSSRSTIFGGGGTKTGIVFFLATGSGGGGGGGLARVAVFLLIWGCGGWFVVFFMNVVPSFWVSV